MDLEKKVESKEIVEPSEKPKYVELIKEEIVEKEKNYIKPKIKASESFIKNKFNDLLRYIRLK